MQATRSAMCCLLTSKSTDGDINVLMSDTHLSYRASLIYMYLLEGFLSILLLVHYGLLPSAASVTDDDEQPNRRDDDGRRDPEPEMAPEGEVVAEELGEAVAEELGSPGLLADNQIRDRT